MTFDMSQPGCGVDLIHPVGGGIVEWGGGRFGDVFPGGGKLLCHRAVCFLQFTIGSK